MKSKATTRHSFRLSCFTFLLVLFVLPAVAQNRLSGTALETLWQTSEQQWKQEITQATNTNAASIALFLEENNLLYLKDRGAFFEGARKGAITAANANAFFDALKLNYLPLYLNFINTELADLQSGRKLINNDDSQNRITHSPCNPACDNINFQTHTFAAWSAYYAVNSSSTSSYLITAVTGGPAGSVTKTGGPDPNTGGSYQDSLILAGGTDPIAGGLISLTPPLGGVCARVGDGAKPGYGVGILQQSFMITSANPILTVQFAVVLENPAHVATQQPFFKMSVLDASGNPITSCGQYFVVASAGLPGFKGIYYQTNADTVYCKPWTTAFVPMNAYIGQCVTVKFEAADCAQGAHLGYAYVACACTNLNITSSSPLFCTGMNYVTLTGPPGLASYKWIGPCIPGPTTTQSIRITCGGNYSLIGASSAGASCLDTFKIVVPSSPNSPAPVPSFTATQVCAGNPTQFTNTSTPLSGPLVSFDWDFYNSGTFNDTITNPAWTYSAGGFYSVLLHENNNGCAVDTIIRVAVDSLYSNSFPVSSVSVTNTSSCSSCDGGAVLNVTGPTGADYSFSNNFDNRVWQIDNNGNLSGTSGHNGSCNFNQSGGPTGGNTWAWQFDFGTCLCPGIYQFYIQSNRTSASSRCSPGRNADTVTFFVNTSGVNITTNITTNAATCGALNGSGTVTGQGGTSPYSYSWSNGPSGATQTGLAPGTYTVEVTDHTGCVGNVAINIPNLPSIQSTVIPYFVKCFGTSDGAIMVTPTAGTAPFTYSWSPVASTLDSVSGLAPGTYSVTVQDHSGCSGTASAVIIQPAQIRDSMIAVINANCATNRGSAQVGAKGGIGSLSYSWSNGALTALDTGLTAGAYTVTITDANACSSTATATITQPVVTVTPAQTDVLCRGNTTGSATATPSGGAAVYTYSWIPAPGAGQGTSTASVLGAGTFTCNITDQNGCQATQTFTIAEPAVALGITPTQTNTTCNGAPTGSATATAAGGTSAYTYSWTPAPGAGQGTLTAGGLIAGIYTCDVTDNHGCLLSQTYTITSPVALTITPSQTDVLCNGVATGSATATPAGGTAAYTYSWTPAPATGQGTITAGSLTGGTYTCDLTDNHGCQTSQLFTINAPASLSIAPTQTDVACNGASTGSATVTASGGTAAYTYNWAPAPGSGQGTLTAGMLGAGTFTCNLTDNHGCTAQQIFTISQPVAALAIAPTQTNVLCSGTPTGTATATASGGTSAYTYSWTPAPGTGQTTATAGGLATGSYTCSLTDHNGCTAQQVFSISTPAALTITPSQTNVLCNGGPAASATATAGGGTGSYTYNWAPAPGTGQGTANAGGLSAGNYTCTLTDQNACLLQQIYTITSPSTLAITPAQTNLLCSGGSTATAVATAAGGSPAYTYSWAPNPGTGQGTANAGGLTAGVYTCIITDHSGCPAQQSYTITAPAALAITPSQTNVLCHGTPTGTATAAPNGGTPTYTFNWVPAPGSGQGTSQIAGLQPNTTYTCTLSDLNACSITATFLITQPPVVVATLTANQSSCNLANGSASATATGGTGVFTYSWTPSAIVNATAPALAAGLYTCFITDAAGCLQQDTISVHNNGVTPVAVITPVGSTTFCQGNTVVLNAGGNGAYSWNTGATTASVTVNLPMTYTLTVTNACGSNSTTVPVTVLPLPIAAVTGGGAVCQGDSLILNASGGATYSWNTGSALPQIAASAAGVYTVTVGNTCGTAIATASVTVNNVTSAFSADSTTGYASFSVQFTDHSSPNATSWAWSFGDGSTANGQTPVHVFNTAGTYTVTETVTSAAGCTSKTTLIIIVNDVISFISIPNVFTPNSDNINDIFVVNSQGISDFDMNIYDRWGIKMTELYSAQEGWDGRTIAGLPASDGTYFYILAAHGTDGKKYDLTGFLMLIR